MLMQYEKSNFISVKDISYWYFYITHHIYINNPCNQTRVSARTIAYLSRMICYSLHTYIPQQIRTSHLYTMAPTNICTDELPLNNTASLQNMNYFRHQLRQLTHSFEDVAHHCYLSEQGHWQDCRNKTDWILRAKQIWHSKKSYQQNGCIRLGREKLSPIPLWGTWHPDHSLCTPPFQKPWAEWHNRSMGCSMDLDLQPSANAWGFGIRDARKEYPYARLELQPLPLP